MKTSSRTEPRSAPRAGGAPHAGAIRRRGLAVLLVLGLLSMTLALSYAMLRAQATTALVQDNFTRGLDARAAAQTGLAVALRRMHEADWAGVDVAVTGQLDAYTSYRVTHATGDASLSATSPDYAEYPFRVTLTSVGTAVDPEHPSVSAQATVTAVVQLVRKRLSAEPSNWSSLQQYTVNQWSDWPVDMQTPVRIEGNVLFQGSLDLLPVYPSYTAAKTRLLQDLNAMRLAGLPDYRPFSGVIYTPTSRQSSTTLTQLQTYLQHTVTNITASTAAPLSFQTSVRTYRLYPGGKLYTLPHLQQVYGTELRNVTLAPNPITNPLGVFRSSGALELNENVSITGTIIQESSTQLLCIEASNVAVSGNNLPAVQGASGNTQLPALIIRNDFVVHGGTQSTVNGMVVVFDEFDVEEGVSSTQFAFQGRFLARDFDVHERSDWPTSSSNWQFHLGVFNWQLANANNPIQYFPQYLQALGLSSQPKITFQPPASGAGFHWQNWSEPVYRAGASDPGLVWSLVSWQETD